MMYRTSVLLGEIAYLWDPSLIKEQYISNDSNITHLSQYTCQDVRGLVLTRMLLVNRSSNNKAIDYVLNRGALRT
jgi:hypothetical protein